MRKFNRCISPEILAWCNGYSGCRIVLGQKSLSPVAGKTRAYRCMVMKWCTAKTFEVQDPKKNYFVNPGKWKKVLWPY